jgi:predicted helicase
MVEQLGIVYTPVEVVDFIIHSVNDVLKQEFDRSLSDENVHILDPFTGTGTFLTRLLQSGLIEEKDLERKYRHELHANEIVLLAYYIASVNIENAFHDATPDPDDGIGKEKYIPFDGIVLTDTFQLGESDNSDKMFSEMFPQNSKRVQRQQKAPLRIIIGNPPYSIGQTSANDNAQNQSYQNLDIRIMETYRAQSTSTSATAVKTLRDSYIKAFRWSSDRLDKSGGIISFVSNGAWLEGNSTDGFRKSLEKEFSTIYVFNLRGNQRTSGELSRKEGGKIFGSGSRTPISITLLVKNPEVKTEKATIHYHDIGDYLDQKEKLKIISDFKSFANPQIPLKALSPNEHGDWISFGNEKFTSFISLAPNKKFNLSSETFFNTYALGVATNRDAWAYNFSKEIVKSNMKRMIEFYNNQVTSFQNSLINEPNILIDSCIDNDPKKISWTAILKNRAKKGELFSFDKSSLRVSAYRPFSKSNSYFNRYFNEAIGLNPKLFPEAESKNVVICLTGEGSLGFSTLITNLISLNWKSGKRKQFIVWIIMKVILH